MSAPEILLVRPAEGGVAYVGRHVGEALRCDGSLVQEVVLVEGGAPAWVGLCAAWRLRAAIRAVRTVHVEFGRTTRAPFWFAAGAMLARRDIALVPHDLPGIVNQPGAGLLDDGPRWRRRVAYRVVSPLLDRPLKAWVMRRAGAVGTFANAAQAGRWGIPRYEVLEHGANPIDERTPSPAPSKGDSVLFCGYLAPDKGIEELFEAWRTVGPTSDLPLVVAGAVGPAHRAWWESLLGRAAGLPVPPRYVGVPDEEEFERLISRAAVIVLPYRASNPVSGVATRAVVRGRPIIGTHVPALDASVEHEVNGLLGTPGDADELAVNLVRLLVAPELRDAYGARGAARARAHHTWPRHVQSLRLLYAKAERTSS